MRDSDVPILGFRSNPGSRRRRQDRVFVPPSLQGICVPQNSLACILTVSKKKGNLQDAINNHFTAGTRFPEREILRLFKGTCEAIRAMHDYRPGGRPSGNTPESSSHPAEEVLDHHGDGDDDGASVPLVAQQHKDAGATIFDGDEEESALERTGKPDEIIPYAHRDLKPAYISHIYASGRMLMLISVALGM
jgi:hypothetical protein